ncbi:MAG: hypothetical protein LBV67_12015, partial [Streptococcaceae bacterium]|nr:hypothetical protein [Streptococcaceae bacterium]
MGKTPKEILAEYEYNEINQLINKKVGDNLQKIEYQYNIRNWLSGINLNSSGNIDNTKLFSYKIKYNNPLNNALKKFNGNISEIDWVYQGEISQRYEYSYDELNRLKLANYKSIGQTTTTDSKFYNEQLSYDLNGNILNLKRNARPMYGQTAVLVDNLDYTYEGNRLTKIFDNTQNTSGYPAVMISQSISYDQNGNMTTMPDKGITEIKYNFLNLPKQITQNGNTTS